MSAADRQHAAWLENRAREAVEKVPTSLRSHAVEVLEIACILRLARWEVDGKDLGGSSVEDALGALELFVFEAIEEVLAGVPASAVGGGAS